MTTLLDELLDQEFRDKLLIYQTFMNSEGPLLNINCQIKLDNSSLHM